MSAQPTAQQVLHLFRSIVRTHGELLPAELRELGNAHTKSEFRAHLQGKAVTSQQWGEFMSSWQGYLAMLRPDHVGSSGGSLRQSADSAMAADAMRETAKGLDELLSPEQRLRMAALKREAASLGQGMLSGGKPGSQTEGRDTP
mmetsp:Transcript_5000/g.8705  ORF Transcript_5000/g.8705 Transcript_5000/m.8705 type:complete len:144 (+) Transcript_5000:71-502(+)